MRIGVPAETRDGETRVAATAETVKKLVGAGHQLRQQASDTAHRRVRERLVVSGRALQVHRRGDQVLRRHRADTGRHRAGHADAGDRTVLQALHTGTLGDQDAPDLQVQHGAALGVAHLHPGASEALLASVAIRLGG